MAEVKVRYIKTTAVGRAARARQSSSSTSQTRGGITVRKVDTSSPDSLLYQASQRRQSGGSTQVTTPKLQTGDGGGREIPPTVTPANVPTARDIRATRDRYIKETFAPQRLQSYRGYNISTGAPVLEDTERAVPLTYSVGPAALPMREGVITEATPDIYSTAYQEKTVDIEQARLNKLALSGNVDQEQFDKQFRISESRVQRAGEIGKKEGEKVLSGLKEDIIESRKQKPSNIDLSRNTLTSTPKTTFKENVKRFTVGMSTGGIVGGIVATSKKGFGGGFTNPKDALRRAQYEASPYTFGGIVRGGGEIALPRYLVTGETVNAVRTGVTQGYNFLKGTTIGKNVVLPLTGSIIGSQIGKGVGETSFSLVTPKGGRSTYSDIELYKGAEEASKPSGFFGKVYNIPTLGKPIATGISEAGKGLGVVDKSILDKKYEFYSSYADEVGATGQQRADLIKGGMLGSVQRPTTEFLSFVGGSAAIEFSGQGLFKEVFKKQTFKDLTRWQFTKQFTKDSVPILGTLGAIEGSVQYEFSRRIYEQPFDRKMAAASALGGAASASILGTAIGLRQVAGKKLGKFIGATETVANIFDITEPVGDFVEKGVVRKLVKPRVITPEASIFKTETITVSGKKEPRFSFNQPKPTIDTSVLTFSSPTNIQVGTTVTAPTQINLPSRSSSRVRTPTFIPTPSQVTTSIKTNVPIPTNIPTNVQVPSLVPTPVLIGTRPIVPTPVPTIIPTPVNIPTNIPTTIPTFIQTNIPIQTFQNFGGAVPPPFTGLVGGGVGSFSLPKAPRKDIRTASLEAQIFGIEGKAGDPILERSGLVLRPIVRRRKNVKKRKK